MPNHLSALAIRAAVVATSTAAAALVAVAPATSPVAAPPAAAHTTMSAPAAVPAPVAVPVALATPAASASATAVRTAMGKLGAPYRWGAAGPSAFDCSGLVTWAFRTVGVSLPRTSRAMSTVGTPVSRSDLRPGDLVFFYRPVSHVGIYIGDGQIVHASSRQSPVKVSDIDRMPWSGARRVA